MQILRARLPSYEFAIGLLTAALAGVVLIATSDIEARYRVALLLTIAGSAFLMAFQDRRVVCVVLWVLIHPLGVEKVFFVNAAEGPQFTDPTIVFNASDGPLFFLTLALVAESLTSGRAAFWWSRLTTVLLAILVWSLISVLVHVAFIGDGLTTSAPFTLAQDVRMILFVLVIQSAVRTHSDLIVVLLAIAVAVLIQSLIVNVSYFTGRAFSYAGTLAPSGAAQLQGFNSSNGELLLRGSGTFGQVNEQAVFQIATMFPLIALFSAKNVYVARTSMVVFALSALALVLTFSRGAWFALPIGVAVCVAIALRRQMISRKGIYAGLLLGMGTAIALVALAQPIYQRLAYGDAGASGARLRLLSLAVDLFATYPLIGVGPGEFDEAALRIYPPGFEETHWIEPGTRYESTSIGRVDYMELHAGDVVVRRPLPVHNKYLLMLSELGIPGLLLWLWLYYEVIRVALRCTKLPGLLERTFGVASLGLVGAELFYMTVEHFHDDKTLELALFAPALTFAVWRFSGSRREPMRNFAAERTARA